MSPLSTALGVWPVSKSIINAACERIAGQAEPPVESALLDVEQVAALLRCSSRHVYRLSDSGKLPRPLKLGALVRWNRTTVLNWISDGCPPVRSARGGRP